MSANGPNVYARVARTPGALYGEPQVCRKRRRCDGHLAHEAHWIEPGQTIVWSALPPNHNDVGNVGWWHHAYCANCAPLPNGLSA